MKIKEDKRKQSFVEKWCQRSVRCCCYSWLCALLLILVVSLASVGINEVIRRNALMQQESDALTVETELDENGAVFWPLLVNS